MGQLKPQPYKTKWYCRATCIEELKADIEFAKREPKKALLVFADEKEQIFAERLYHINKKNEFFQTAKDYMWKNHGVHTYPDDFKVIEKLNEHINKLKEVKPK